MVEGLPAHLGLDVDAEHVPPIGDDDHQAGVEHVDRPGAPQAASEDQRQFAARAGGRRRRPSPPCGKPSSSRPDTTAQEKSSGNSAL